jgi:hypothetical protein
MTDPILYIPDLTTLPVEPMSKKVTSMFALGAMFEAAAGTNFMSIDQLNEHFAEELEDRLTEETKILLKRLELAQSLTTKQLMFDPSTVLFIRSALITNLGELVMWSHFIVMQTFKKPLDFLGLSILFPKGFQTVEAMHEAWNKQKMSEAEKNERQSIFAWKMDNRLDTIDAWKEPVSE